MVWKHKDPAGSHGIKTKLHGVENSFWETKNMKMFLLKSQSLIFSLHWAYPRNTWIRLLWEVASVAFFSSWKELPSRCFITLTWGQRNIRLKNGHIQLHLEESHGKGLLFKTLSRKVDLMKYHRNSEISFKDTRKIKPELKRHRKLRVSYMFIRLRTT